MSDMRDVIGKALQLAFERGVLEGAKAQREACAARVRLEFAHLATSEAERAARAVTETPTVTLSPTESAQTKTLQSTPGDGE